jgi:hypothetical protein
MIETTYDLVVRAEALMYCATALLALAFTVYGLCAAWLKAAEVHSRVQYNRMEWEQQRQYMLSTDEKGNYCVHEDTSEFYQLDAE